MVAANGDVDDLLTVTRRGYGKRTKLTEYRAQSRNGKGLIDIKTGDRNGPVTEVKTVIDDDHLVMMSERGQIMRIRAADISEVGRNTMGVTVMDVNEDDRVASVDVIPAEAAEATPDDAETADEESTPVADE